jgi:Calx-beta domain
MLGSRDHRWLRHALAVLLPVGLIAFPMLFGSPQRARAEGDSISVAEGDSGAVDVPVLISLSTPMEKTARVAFSTADATATAGQDYVPTSGTVVFRPGETRQTVHVTVLGDRVREGDESFYLVTDGSRTTINILDDDPSIQISGTAITEGDAGVHDLAFVITLLQIPSSNTTSTTATPTSIPPRVPEPVAVNFATVDGTALGGQDYVPVSGTVVLQAGAAQTVITVPVIGDTIPERDEGFFVRVFDPSRGEITIAVAQGTIVNDDAVGFTGEAPPGFALPGSPPPPGALPSSVSGVREVTSSGAVLSAGDAAIFGSADEFDPNQPIVGIASTPSRNGYWLVASDGGIFAFGDANFFGSTGAIRLNTPIVGMAATPTGNGYWLVASDGGIFAFGDAKFLGSTAGVNTVQPIVGMASTPTGNGYWLVTAHGGIFPFGDAQFLGAVGGRGLNKPVVGIAATPTGGGYWLVASDGGVFSFGDARFFGSTGGITLNEPIVGIVATPSGNGYWLIARDRGLFAFGDAPYLPRIGGLPSSSSVVGLAP